MCELTEGQNASGCINGEINILKYTCESILNLYDCIGITKICSALFWEIF